MSSDLSNWIIAAAAIGNFVVYFLLWRQTQALFLESRQPALSVAITRCSYDSPSETFRAQIKITNRGPVAAQETRFKIRFGTVGFGSEKDIGPIVIQPEISLTWPMACSMKTSDYALADSDGNRLWAVVDGSYRGTGNRSFGCSEHHEYHRVLDKFVPKWTITPASTLTSPTWRRVLSLLAHASS